MEQDQAYWENRVASAVRVKQAADIPHIARLCVESQARGETAGAWHASAQFYGYLHRCNCFPCASTRKPAALPHHQDQP